MSYPLSPTLCLRAVISIILLAVLGSACNSGRADPTDAGTPGVAVRAPSPLVEGAQGPEALWSKEEQAFYEASAEVVCLVLREGGEARATPELLTRAQLVLARRGFEPARFDSIQRAYRDHAPAIEAIGAQVRALCPDVAERGDPSGVLGELGPGLKWRSGPLEGILAQGSSEGTETSDRYVRTTVAMGCGAIVEGAKGARRSDILQAEGFDEAKYASKAAALRGDPEVGARIARGIQACAGEP